MWGASTTRTIAFNCGVTSCGGGKSFEEELVLPQHVGLIIEFIAHGTVKVELWLLYFNDHLTINLTVVILFLQAKVISFMCQFSFRNKAIGSW